MGSSKSVDSPTLAQTMRRVIAALYALLVVCVAAAVIAAGGRWCCWLSRLSTGSALEPLHAAPLADAAAVVSLAFARMVPRVLVGLWVGLHVALTVLAAVTAHTTTLCATPTIDCGASATTASRRREGRARSPRTPRLGARNMPLCCRC